MGIAVTPSGLAVRAKDNRHIARAPGASDVQPRLPEEDRPRQPLGQAAHATAVAPEPPILAQVRAHGVPTHGVADEEDFHVAAMFFYSIIHSMFLMYMLNFPDPQVKHYSSKLLSGTLGILVGVLLEQASMDLYWWAFSEGEEGPGPGIWGLLPIYQTRAQKLPFLYIFWMFVTFASAYHYRADEMRLAAVLDSLPHAASFVLLDACGQLMKVINEGLKEDGEEWTAYKANAAFVFVSTFVQCTFCVSIRLIGGHVLGATSSAAGPRQHAKALQEEDGVAKPADVPAPAATAAVAEPREELADPDAQPAPPEADHLALPEPTTAHLAAAPSSAPPRLRGSRGSKGGDLMDGLGHGHGLNAWFLEACDECEHGAALLSAYLTRHALMYAITGAVPHPPWHSSNPYVEYATQDVTWLNWKIGASMLLAILVLILLAPRLEGGGPKPAWGFRLAGIYAKCLLAWMGGELCYQITVETMGLHRKMEIYSARASLTTAFNFLMIVLLDWFADRWQAFEQYTELLVNAGSLWMGFAWEQAIYMCMHEFGQHFARKMESPLMTRAVPPALCVFLVLFVAPGWLMFIIPLAKQPSPPRHCHTYVDQSFL